MCLGQPHLELFDYGSIIGLKTGGQDNRHVGEEALHGLSPKANEDCLFGGPVSNRDR